MCGRYVTHAEQALEREFTLIKVRWPDYFSYNVAPTQQVPVVRSVNGEREGSMMRWGLIPFFAKGDPGKYSTINARIETVKTSPAYRGPWKRGQRCLILADGFYEWQVTPDGKVPYYITCADPPQEQQSPSDKP